MRTDIEYDLEKNDVVIEKQNRYTAYTSEVVEPDNTEVGNVYVQVDIGENSPEDGFYVHIDYLPDARPLVLLINYTENGEEKSEYYTVGAALYGGTLSEITGSELVLVNDEFEYYVEATSDSEATSDFDAQIYSAYQSDFNMTGSQWQDANFLLQCVPTNNYRYPVAGVGLIRWVHSGEINGEGVRRLKEEFTDDGMTIINANYDYENEKLYLKLQDDE